jgi:hypothetical protein
MVGREEFTECPTKSFLCTPSCKLVLTAALFYSTYLAPVFLPFVVEFFVSFLSSSFSTRYSLRVFVFHSDDFTYSTTTLAISILLLLHLPIAVTHLSVVSHGLGFL